MKHPAVTQARMLLIVSFVAILLPYGSQGLPVKDNPNMGVQEAAEEATQGQQESNTEVELLSKIRDRLRLMHIQALEESKTLLEKILQDVEAELRNTNPKLVLTRSQQETLMLFTDNSPSRRPGAVSALSDVITKLNRAIEEQTDESHHDEHIADVYNPEQSSSQQDLEGNHNEADDIDKLLQTISRGIKNPPGKRDKTESVNAQHGGKLNEFSHKTDAQHTHESSPEKQLLAYLQEWLDKSEQHK